MNREDKLFNDIFENLFPQAIEDGNVIQPEQDDPCPICGGTMFCCCDPVLKNEDVLNYCLADTLRTAL